MASCPLSTLRSFLVPPNFSQPLGGPLVAWQPLEMWGGLRQPAELQEEAEGLWTVLEGS